MADEYFKAIGGQINIEGGHLSDGIVVVGTDIDLASGSIGQSLTALEGSRLWISGGEVGGSLGLNNSTVEIAGGNVARVTMLHSGFELTGGTIGDDIRLVSSRVDIAGGQIGDRANVVGDSTVSISGGTMGSEFTIGSGVQGTISGGRFGRLIDVQAGSSMEIIGGEFTLNGEIVNDGQITLSSTDVFAGTFADGNAFLFGGLVGDKLHEVSYQTVVLGPAQPQSFDVSSPISSAPHGLRSGQSLLLSDTGELSADFTANGASIVMSGGTVGDYLQTSGTTISINGGRIGSNALFAAGSHVDLNGGSIDGSLIVQNSTLRIDGGTTGSMKAFSGEITLVTGEIGLFSEVTDSSVFIRGGTVASRFTAGQGSVVAITAGTINSMFTAASGSRIDIRGGSFSSSSPFGDPQFTALAGSEINFYGIDFTIDGIAIQGLSLGESVTLDQRDVTLAGTLLDGSNFSFVLNSSTSRPFSFQSAFDLNATITLTRISAIGDYNDDGEVNAADYTVWADSFGSMTNLAADGNGNGTIDAADYTIWADNFGQSTSSPQNAIIPEPATMSLVMVGLAWGLKRRRV